MIEVSVQNESPYDLPTYATGASAGVNLRAVLEAPLVLQPLERKIIGTGLKIALPEGFEAQVRPRAGLAAKHGVTVLNSPGTIDADYRGEIKVILINLGDQPVMLSRAERIAQMVIAPVTRTRLHEVETLENSARGSGGFGSTGIKS